MDQGGGIVDRQILAVVLGFMFGFGFGFCMFVASLNVPVGQ